MRGLLIYLLAVLPLCAQPWSLEIATARERADLEWALETGAKLFPTQRPGLASLRDRLAGVESDDEGPGLVENSRADALAAWALYVETFRAPVEWSGSIPRGDPGALSAASVDAIVTRINYFRTLSGLAPVRNVVEFNARCQAVCLYLSGNPDWKISHTLDPAGKFYTVEAAATALQACIDKDSEGVEAVDDFYRDWGLSSLNAAVPHRQWLNLPGLEVVGVGAIPAHDGWPASACIYVGGPRGEAVGPWAWPPAGAFPLARTPERWSVYSPTLNLRGSVVRVNGAAVASAAFPAIRGYILVFEPPWKHMVPSVHEVDISGPWPLRYTVERFNPSG